MATRDAPRDETPDQREASARQPRAREHGEPADSRRDEREEPRGAARRAAPRPVSGHDLVALNRREPPPSSPPPPRVGEGRVGSIADALDPDRILELPPRRPAVSRLDTQGEKTPPGDPAPIARILPAVPRIQSYTPSSPRPPHSAPTNDEPRPGALISLREAAQPYLARLAARRSSDDAASANRGQDRYQADETTPPARPRGNRREETPPDPICPLCNGAGFVRLDVPVGDKLFGQAVRCECKEREIEERERRKLRDLSSLKPFDKKSFETFDPAIPGVAEAYQVAQRYAEDPGGWLILQGGYGCGKTHLAAAIARTREDAGETVFFSIVPDLLDHLRATYAPASEITYDELFDRVRHVGLLVLDDLGSENATAWATEKLFQIINYRYNYRLPTVITTNVRLLSHLDERIRSRLSDLSLVRWVAIESGDYRERHAGHAGPGGTGRQPRRSAPRGGGSTGGPRGGGYGR